MPGQLNAWAAECLASWQLSAWTQQLATALLLTILGHSSSQHSFTASLHLQSDVALHSAALLAAAQLKAALLLTILGLDACHAHAIKVELDVCGVTSALHALVHPAAAFARNAQHLTGANLPQAFVPSCRQK
jgi:hypothetical protein